jgi:predicted nuclease of predicted toxin-antitoxin system
MNIWIDAQLPSTLACWITNNFEVEAAALRDLGLRDARDIEIFEAARVAGRNMRLSQTGSRKEV